MDINERLSNIEVKLDILMTYIVPTEKPKILLSDYLNVWLNEFRNNVSTSTLYKDSTNIKYQIVPNLGNYLLTDLSTLILQQYINGINAPRQRKHLFILLKNALRKATDLGYIDKNPMLQVILPEHEPTPTAILSQKDIEKFLQIAKNTTYFIAFYTLIYQGFRPSELLALDRNSLLEDSIYITNSWNSKDKVIGKTKTKNSIRNVPYFENVKELLFNLKCEDRLFPYQLRHLEDAFADIVHTRDFITDFVPRGRLTLYSLRHTCITRWAENGVHPRVAMKWAGHNNITTTLHYYTHISSDWEQLEVEKTSSKIKKVSSKKA